MKLRRGIRRDIFTGDIHMTGQHHVDAGEGIHSGWDVKTWSDPKKPEIHLPTELH